MKRFNYMKVALVGLLATASMMVACSKSSSSSDPGIVGAFGGCTNCNFAQAVLFTAPSQFMNDFQFSFRVIGDANQINALQASNQSVIDSYRGTVAVDGTMVVRSQQYVGQCMIPPGTYQIATVQAGQWDGSQRGLQIPQFQAIGNGISFLMSLNGGTTGAFRIVGRLDFLQGPAQYGYPGYPQPYPQQPGYPAQGMMACNDMYGGFILN